MANALKSVEDMRVMLSEEITKLREGNTNAANVNAIVNATGKILSTVKLEIEYNKMIGSTPNIPFIPAGQKRLLEKEAT